jgi:hypothetical protein
MKVAIRLVGCAADTDGYCFRRGGKDKKVLSAGFVR